MLALRRGILLLLCLAGLDGCILLCRDSACIHRGEDPLFDRCFDDQVDYVCDGEGGEEDDDSCTCEEQREPPFECDDVVDGSTCRDEGFRVECGDGTWSKDGAGCGR